MNFIIDFVLSVVNNLKKTCMKRTVEYWLGLDSSGQSLQ